MSNLKVRLCPNAGSDLRLSPNKTKSRRRKETETDVEMEAGEQGGSDSFRGQTDRTTKRRTVGKTGRKTQRDRWTDSGRQSQTRTGSDRRVGGMGAAWAGTCAVCRLFSSRRTCRERRPARPRRRGEGIAARRRRQAPGHHPPLKRTPLRVRGPSAPRRPGRQRAGQASAAAPCASPPASPSRLRAESTRRR